MFRQNKYGFFSPLPHQPPPAIASHERLSPQPLRFPSAVVSQVLCHTVASGFLMPSCGFARYVRSHGAKRTEAAPVTTSQEPPVPRGVGWPGPKSHTAPCVASEGFAWGSCSLCVAFARRLHGVRTALARHSHALCGPLRGFTTRPAVGHRREP